MGVEGELFTGGGPKSLVAEMDVGGETGGGEKGCGVGTEVGIAVPRNKFGAGRGGVGNGGAVDGHTEFDGGLKQGGFEGEDGGAVGGGTFGVKDDAAVLPDQIGYESIHAVNIAAGFAVDKKGVGAAGKGTDAGPFGDFGIADKPSWRGGAEEEDIGVAYMIGDEEEGSFGWSAVDTDGHADDPSDNIAIGPHAFAEEVVSSLGIVAGESADRDGIGPQDHTCDERAGDPEDEAEFADHVTS